MTQNKSAQSLSFFLRACGIKIAPRAYHYRKSRLYCVQIRVVHNMRQHFQFAHVYLRVLSRIKCVGNCSIVYEHTGRVEYVPLRVSIDTHSCSRLFGTREYNILFKLESARLECSYVSASVRS